MSSLMSGGVDGASSSTQQSVTPPPSQQQQPAQDLIRNKDTIDFLHFIRYLNIVYKSDINVRLKFLYGVSMNSKRLDWYFYKQKPILTFVYLKNLMLKDTQKRIQIYDSIFEILESKYSTNVHLDTKRDVAATGSSSNNSSSATSDTESSSTSKSVVQKSSLPLMNQVGDCKSLCINLVLLINLNIFFSIILRMNSLLFGA